MAGKSLKNLLVLGLSSAASLFATSSTSFGSLVIDLRVANSGAKSASVSSAGSVVNIDVYALVQGSNATTDETFTSLQGSFVDNTVNGGSAIGNFSVFTPRAPFNSGALGGKVQQLNGSPGLDVGTFDGNNANFSSLDVVSARAGSAQTATAAGTPSTAVGDLSSFLVGTLTYTVQSVPNTGTTSLVFVPRTLDGANTSTSALWTEDGATRTGATGVFTSSPLLVTVPEPTSLGIAAVGGLGILARRRRVTA